MPKQTEKWEKKELIILDSLCSPEIVKNKINIASIAGVRRGDLDSHIEEWKLDEPFAVIHNKNIFITPEGIEKRDQLLEKYPSIIQKPHYVTPIVDGFGGVVGSVWCLTDQKSITIEQLSQEVRKNPDLKFVKVV